MAVSAVLKNSIRWLWTSIGLIPPLYLGFQLFRFVALIMFTIFMVDCTVYHSETSVDCKNFTRYTKVNTPGCDAYCWKGLWIICSIITSGIALCFLTVPNKLTEQLRPASSIKVMQTLLVKPYFWYMNMIFILVMLYDALIETQNLAKGSSAVEGCVIMSKFLTLCLIFQLNFTYPPYRPEYSWVTISLYHVTLVMFLLDNLCKFVELSIWVSYKLYAINPDNHRQAVQVLLFQVIDLSLYHSFLSFFWSKIFRGKKDVLMVYTPDLAQSVLGIQHQQHTYQPMLQSSQDFTETGP
ncbi:uncharacterized protein LOC110250776 [Exaiptasia diaphana]|uniref:Uncharacterized protein n=1 Tax=Exaiptasia diaphana TaxID=2652724 RepID=A0A913Y107_EXADI|nr:uncharacterized protein LOC110250776 [Exaiptasia diaphana]